MKNIKYIINLDFKKISFNVTLNSLKEVSFNTKQTFKIYFKAHYYVINIKNDNIYQTLKIALKNYNEVLFYNAKLSDIKKVEIL